MRREMLYDCRSARQARRIAPWAAIVRKVEGGYMAWESVADYDTWRGQR